MRNGHSAQSESRAIADLELATAIRRGETTAVAIMSESVEDEFLVDKAQAAF